MSRLLTEAKPPDQAGSWARPPPRVREPRTLRVPRLSARAPHPTRPQRPSRRPIALKSAAAKEPHRISLAALGSSPSLREAERALESLAQSRKPILILGEAGTGHDVAARALAQRDAPFLVLTDGSRLTANPLSLIEEAHEGIIYCPEIGQYGKSEQK